MSKLWDLFYMVLTALRPGSLVACIVVGLLLNLTGQTYAQETALSTWKTIEDAGSLYLEQTISAPGFPEQSNTRVYVGRGSRLTATRISMDVMLVAWMQESHTTVVTTVWRTAVSQVHVPMLNCTNPVLSGWYIYCDENVFYIDMPRETGLHIRAVNKMPDWYTHLNNYIRAAVSGETISQDVYNMPARTWSTTKASMLAMAAAKRAEGSVERVTQPRTWFLSES